MPGARTGADLTSVLAVGQVMVRWVDVGGVERRCEPAGVEASVFHENRPVRRFGRYDDMAHFPGLYWCATTDKLVGFESWCERAWALVMDFDPGVSGIASQPFQLIGRDESGVWRHVPDYWATRPGRPPLVLDVRSGRHFEDEGFVRLSHRTRGVCEQLGWDYRVVHEVDPVVLANIDFLSAYRRRFPDPLGLRPTILAAAAEGPATVAGLCAQVGEPVVVLPQLFALCWQHHLRFDLTAHLRYDTTQVSISAWAVAVSGP